MTARELFVAADGELRAPWRLLGFVALCALLIPLVGAFTSFAAARWGVSAFAATNAQWLIALLVAHVIMLRWVDGKPWSTVGLGAGDLRAPALARGALVGALAIGLPSAMLLAVGWLRPEAEPAGGAAWGGYALRMALLLAPASLWEELAFRGYGFTAIRDGAGGAVALVLTSVVFGAVHAGNPGVTPRALLLVAVAGLLLGAIRLVTGSLYAAWVAHLAWNWVMAALVHTEVSGYAPEPPPGYRVVDAGPDWATGGAWGPEGGAIAGLGMAAGLAYLYIHLRHGRGNRHD